MSGRLGRKLHAVYNTSMDTTLKLVKRSVEYKLVLLYLDTESMEQVEASPLFDQYVEEIYRFKYGAGSSDADAKALEKGVCRVKARKNIAKKAKHGVVACTTMIPLKTALEFDKVRKEGDVKEHLENAIRSTIAERSAS